MGAFEQFDLVPNTSDSKDHLHINVRGGGIKISSNLSSFRFLDKDTKQYIFFIPSLDISGYGETPQIATEMAKFCLDDFYEGLSKLSRKDIEKELFKLGWKKGLFNKDFSKAYVDGLGELKNFNVELDKVEKLTITAA